jgi:fimbrial chaperone protein
MAMVFALLVASGGVVCAATLQISPVMVELAAGDNASGLTLRNPGDKPLYGQVRVFKWSQANGEEILAPTQDIVASPPLIQIPAQAEQLVRLVRPSMQPANAEQSYRLLIDELPEPDAKLADGVTIRLRYSVPVFVEPAGPPRLPELIWSISRAAQGWQLGVENAGAHRAQISAIELVDASGKAYVLNKGLLGYALAGQHRQWPITLPSDAEIGGEMTVRAAVNASPVSTSIRVQPQP